MAAVLPSGNPPTSVLITGCASGIGYEAVKLLLENDRPDVIYRVFMTAQTEDQVDQAAERLRSELDWTQSRNELITLELDIRSDESIDKACQFVRDKYGKLDVLVNNAGEQSKPPAIVSLSCYLGTFKRLIIAGAQFDSDFLNGNVSLRESFNRVYDINVTGANATAWKFMPLLLNSPRPRLIFVTSGLAQVTTANNRYQHHPAGWPKKINQETIGYRCSKVALNMLTLDWAQKLKLDNVKVHGINPGFLATNFSGELEKVRNMGASHPRKGAALYKAVIEGGMDQFVGKVINKSGLSPL